MKSLRQLLMRMESFVAAFLNRDEAQATQTSEWRD
jgi:hypothetical protein